MEGEILMLDEQQFKYKAPRTFKNLRIRILPPERHLIDFVNRMSRHVALNRLFGSKAFGSLNHQHVATYLPYS